MKLIYMTVRIYLEIYMKDDYASVMVFEMARGEKLLN